MQDRPVLHNYFENRRLPQKKQKSIKEELESVLSFHECVLNTLIYTIRSKRDKRRLRSSYLGALLSPKTTVSTPRLIP